MKNQHVIKKRDQEEIKKWQFLVCFFVGLFERFSPFCFFCFWLLLSVSKKGCI